MGGAQSNGAHTLGDALWVQERQRQKCHREESQCDSHGSLSSTPERRKLLKRTRSLAVISEDDSRFHREIPQFRIGEPNLDLTRRPQLIPRAKLIDRNSLKDRLSKSQQHLTESYDRFNETKSYQSRSSCALYSPPPLTLLPDPLPYVRGNRPDSARLNILDWPDQPRKYCSVQNLDTVTGLVEIVEDNWPLEENRSLDCIYTQVKRKRKEHRSLDSILFEDDGELDYFDVLNLLPLSNSRLGVEEGDKRSCILNRGSEKDDFFDGILSSSDKESTKDFYSSAGNNETDEEKSKNQEDEGWDSNKVFWVELISPSKKERKDFWEDIGDQEQRRQEKIQEQILLGEEKFGSELTLNADLELFERREEEEECVRGRNEGKEKEEVGREKSEELRKEGEEKVRWERTEIVKRERESDGEVKRERSEEIKKERGEEVKRGRSGKIKRERSEEVKRNKDPKRDKVAEEVENRKVESKKEIKECQKDDREGSGIKRDHREGSKERKKEERIREHTIRDEEPGKKITEESGRFKKQSEDTKSEQKLFQATNPFPKSLVIKNFQNSLVDKYRANVAIVSPCEEKLKVEEVEEVRSIWISDEEEEMSRRPQVLKIIDNDLTKRCNKYNATIDKKDPLKDSTEVVGKRGSIESARNFFEKKSTEKEIFKNPPVEGRFERIVKETSNIFGKACSAVKGTLGFEARSESSDLGLGSEIENETRRQSVDDETSAPLENSRSKEKSARHEPKVKEEGSQNSPKEESNETRKCHTNLTRSRSCVDSIECQDEPEFDHVRYKIVKSNLFGKNIFSTSKGDVTYEGLMDYLREYSFQELLLDNNVVIIEPVRAEVERKPSMNVKSKSLPTCRVSGTMQKKRDLGDERKNFKEMSRTCPRQSSLRKHFFYHPIRVNKELIDDELPNPDTVKNVTRMFEESLKAKKNVERDKTRRSLSMKDLSLKDEGVKDDEKEFDERVEKVRENRSRSSSRAKDLTRLFENLEKKTNSSASIGGKDDPESPRSESKTRILAQSFEARSGHTSPSDSNSSNKNRVSRFNQHNRHHNWDAGSVSSGVSSDYPDTDPGSAQPCTSSEDEEIDCQDEEGEDERGPGHYVSQDVLRKIRECGTSVTYYGGKVVNTYNGPIISPVNIKLSRRKNQLLEYIKFRLVKSNSCDSRLELTGKLVDEKIKPGNWEKNSDLRECTIAEMPSIELTPSEKHEQDQEKIKEPKKVPPVVIGLEPKKDEGKNFRADFKLGKMEESNPRFSALSRWQINENGWRKSTEFGKIEFEEFEVLEDSLNTTDNQT